MKRLLAIAGLFFLIGTSYIAFVVLTLPDVKALARTNPKSTAMMEQRAAENGTKVATVRTWVSYNRISPHLRNAVLISEDSAFFQHSGFDMAQIKESVIRNWEEKAFARGASTITQQLAKNLYLSTSKNPLRKIREAFIADAMERHLTKQRIFEIYLNVIEWGDGVYGIESAARQHFGKSASDLQPEEAAILAAMIPNPRRYTPSRNLAFLERRKKDILDRLSRWGYLEKEEYEAARVRPVVFRQVSQAQ